MRLLRVLATKASTPGSTVRTRTLLLGLGDISVIATIPLAFEDERDPLRELRDVIYPGLDTSSLRPPVSVAAAKGLDLVILAVNRDP